MIKETIFALMLVTSDGAWEIAEFDSLDACKEAKAEVTQQDTFCYKRDPISTEAQLSIACLLYTSPSPRDLSTSRMPSSA